MSLAPRDNSPELIARPSQIELISEELRCATAALHRAGFTRCDSGQWKPPTGKPAGPLLGRLDAERQQARKLALATMALVRTSLQAVQGQMSPVEMTAAMLEAIDEAIIVLESQP